MTSKVPFRHEAQSVYESASYKKMKEAHRVSLIPCSLLGTQPYWVISENNLHFQFTRVCQPSLATLGHPYNLWLFTVHSFNCALNDLFSYAMLFHQDLSLQPDCKVSGYKNHASAFSYHFVTLIPRDSYLAESTIPGNPCVWFAFTSLVLEYHSHDWQPQHFFLMLCSAFTLLTLFCASRYLSNIHRPWGKTPSGKWALRFCPRWSYVLRKN